SYTVFHKYQPLQVSLLGTKDVWQASNLHSFHIQEKKIAYFSLSPSTSFAIVLLKSSSASSTASGSLMILLVTSCFTRPECSTSAWTLSKNAPFVFAINSDAFNLSFVSYMSLRNISVQNCLTSFMFAILLLSISLLRSSIYSCMFGFVRFSAPIERAVFLL